MSNFVQRDLLNATIKEFGWGIIVDKFNTVQIHQLINNLADENAYQFLFTIYNNLKSIELLGVIENGNKLLEPSSEV